jgi:hypothetical protein
MTGKKHQDAKVAYRLRCTSKTGRLGTLWANSEARQETLKCNPAYLQMYKGQKIYFNPAVDTIFLDLHYLYALFYLSFSRVQRKSPLRRSLARFRQVQSLATPLLEHRILGLGDVKREVLRASNLPYPLSMAWIKMTDSLSYCILPSAI